MHPDPWYFWGMAILAAVVIGVAKTGVPGIGILVVPILVSIYPEQPKTAVGAMLPMLICGDVFAVSWYRHHAEWSRLIGLIPGILIGMVIGGLLLNWLPDAAMKPVLGWTIVALVVAQILTKRFGLDNVPHHPLFAWAIGSLAGVATTVANMAGPIMGIYFLAVGFSKEKFIGTGAWYYLTVNSMKVPLYVVLGMVTLQTLKFNVVLVPAIVVGAIVGKLILPYIPRLIFDSAVLLLAVLSGLRMALA